MSLHDYLARTDRDYDPTVCLVAATSGGPGYHTQIPPGTRVHPTRDALEYTIALLQSGEPERASRACDIIDAIVALQVTDPTAMHYGIWGWFAEEPPTKMNPADWNWADFLGARIAQALIIHRGQLRPSTITGARTALNHAALSIFRRNVDAGYTNIAVMGGVVAAAAGELLNQPFLVDYGRRKLGNVLSMAERLGGFSEYNSPTYSRVALEESERALLLVRDPGVRELAERLRRLAWRTLAERFHPGTGQMAGPNSRAYSDWLMPALADYMTRQTGVSIRPRVSGNDAKKGPHLVWDSVPPMACPSELAGRFASLPSDPHEITTQFAAGAAGEIFGTTWFTKEACLGSVNRGIGWIQQRPIAGYWKTPEDSAVCLRSRMLKDNVDFSSSIARTAQRAGRVLSTWSLCYNGGDFHPILNKPPGSNMSFVDLRARVGLQGIGTSVRRIDERRFELFAGEWRAVVHAAAATFMGHAVEWRISQHGDTACIDAVLKEGNAQALDFHHADLKLAFGMEILTKDQSPTTAVIECEEKDGRATWKWGGLEVNGPTVAESFVW